MLNIHTSRSHIPPIVGYEILVALRIVSVLPPPISDFTIDTQPDPVHLSNMTCKKHTTIILCDE